MWRSHITSNTISLYFKTFSFIDGAEDPVQFLAIHGGIVEPHVPLQSLDLLHIFSVEGEAKEVEVLPYPLPVGGLWDH